jgi:hypothetical protein
VLRGTTRRGLCRLVYPPRTSERGGEGACVKEGGGEEGERGRERTLGLLLCYSPDDMRCLLVLNSVTSTPQWIRQPMPCVYLKEGTYHTRLFRGPSTNGMKK